MEYNTGNQGKDGTSTGVYRVLADHAGYDDTLGLGDRPAVEDPVVGQIAELIAELIDVLQADDPDVLMGGGDSVHEGDAATVGRLRDIGTVIDRLEAERLRLLRAAETAGVLGRDGYANASVWLRRTTTLTAAESGRRGKVARRLTHLPEIAAAFADGRIGLAHASLIERMATDVGMGNVAAVQRPLIVAAVNLRDVKQFADLCTGWRNALAPDFLDERDRKNWERRRAGFVTIDGRGHLWASFDAEAAALIATAIDAFTTHDEPDVPADSRRTREQRVADALADIAARVLDSGAAPTTGRQRPHVNVTIPLQLITGNPGGSGSAGTPGSSGMSGGVPVCGAATVDWVGAVGRDTALRLLDDSSLTRILLGQNAQPLDVGTATRIWPVGIRKAITLRDGHCRFPGCDRPHTWTDIDHVIQVEDGGATALDNGILLCRTHHRMKTRRGWWPTLHSCGTITWKHATHGTRTTHPTAHQQQWIQTLINHPHTDEPESDRPESGQPEFEQPASQHPRTHPPDNDEPPDDGEHPQPPQDYASEPPAHYDPAKPPTQSTPRTPRHAATTIGHAWCMTQVISRGKAARRPLDRRTHPPPMP